MPKLKTYRGMFPNRLAVQLGNNLHIDNKVYRVSDLSEVIGAPAAPMTSSMSPVAYNNAWTIRMMRGYQPMTPNVAGGSPGQIASDFDMVLCGRWNGVEICHQTLPNGNIRNFSDAGLAMVYDWDPNTGNVSNPASASTYTTSLWNHEAVWLPSVNAGRLAMTRHYSNSYLSASVESFPVGTTTAGQTTLLFGSRALGPMFAAHRVGEDTNRWYFVDTYVGASAIQATMEVRAVAKATLAAIAYSTSLGAPAGASTISTGMGYAQSAPSFAWDTLSNEKSSYVIWRSATAMEIHRVAMSSLDATPAITNNLVTLDQNPMTLTQVGVMRVQLINHTDGNKYLLVIGFENSAATPTTALQKMYVYKLTDKNTATYVGTYNLAPSPRSMTTADDNGMNFVVAYDDRYEFWSVGTGGVLNKTNTVTLGRVSATQYYGAWSHGFDSAGRFWYINPISATPATMCEWELWYINPTGTANTINLSFDSGSYSYSGAPASGTLTVSVTDANGNYVAANVTLTPSTNVTLSQTTFTTSATGPTLVPFTITAPGDISIDAATS
ncbi:hypothetical protein [Ralstonia phage RP31]|uniref:Uncharacterized protein n=2 Tax=Ripduovirus RP12 TaxID=2560700 RepID=A0A1L7N0Y1_9CAUD|nr:hypothetical protein FDH28_gp269 [Ralstonia phage RP12]BAW19126.1 hypothetical protein [Ralstonia phage RP12]BAW19412.1 hypothetical protein [Ralstonia phage RP31]